MTYKVAGMSTPEPPAWRVMKVGDVTCPASVKVSIGAPGEMSQAGLFCDLVIGHDSLHYDSTDHIWWRPDDQS